MTSALLASFHFRSAIIVSRAAMSLHMLNSSRWELWVGANAFLLIIDMFLILILYVSFSPKWAYCRILVLKSWILIKSLRSILSNGLVSILSNFNLLTLRSTFLTFSSICRFSFSRLEVAHWADINSRSFSTVSVRLHSTRESLIFVGKNQASSSSFSLSCARKSYNVWRFVVNTRCHGL
jgi:hypothetical protein